MTCVMTRAFGALILAALTVVAVTGAAALAGSSGNGGGGLSKHDRELLAQAKADGKQDVVLIIASKGGANRDVVKAIEAQGGSILNKDDSLGYVLARVATDKVKAVAAHRRDPGARPRRGHPARRSAAGRGRSPPTPQTPPSAATPTVNPYMPMRDTELGRVHGRATRPGTAAASRSASSTPASTSTIRACNVDEHGRGEDHRLGHRHAPERALRRPDLARHVEPGQRRRRLVHGRHDDLHGVAADGTYRFGVFNERDPRLGGEVGNDVNRDGNPAGSSGIFAVLWERRTTRSSSTPTRTGASRARPR